MNEVRAGGMEETEVRSLEEPKLAGFRERLNSEDQEKRVVTDDPALSDTGPGWVPAPSHATSLQEEGGDLMEAGSSVSTTTLRCRRDFQVEVSSTQLHVYAHCLD